MEATVAVNFILSYLYNKLPRRRVDMFGELLEKQLQTVVEKCWSMQYEQHQQQQLYSTIVGAVGPGNTDASTTAFTFSLSYPFYVGINNNQIDPLLTQVALTCLIQVYEMLSYFPQQLTLILEPGRVQYRMCYDEPPVDIWQSDKRRYQVLDLLKQQRLQQMEQSQLESSVWSASVALAPSDLGDQPSQQQQQQSSLQQSDTLASVLEKLSLGVGVAPPPSTWPVHQQAVGAAASSTGSQTYVHVSSEGCFIHKSSSTPNFTAASFAQTKFGSTKLKTQARRSSRISTYLAQQRSLAAAAAAATAVDLNLSLTNPPDISILPSSVMSITDVTSSVTDTFSSVLSNISTTSESFLPFSIESIFSSSGTGGTITPAGGRGAASSLPFSGITPIQQPPGFTTAYFDNPTSMVSQRSISLSPGIRPQRGQSPPYSYNIPLILPPFTSTVDISGILSQHPQTTSSTISNIEETPTFVITTTSDDI